MEIHIKTTEPRLKPCKVCGNVYPETFEFFYKNNTYLSGFTNKCRTCENEYQRLRAQTWYMEKRKIICKNYKLSLRKELLNAYGHACSCCGETTDEFLEIDHIHGGGNQHRKREKRDLYSVIKQEGYPKDRYRLLCSNCNHAIGMKGYCPHQKNKLHGNTHQNDSALKAAV